MLYQYPTKEINSVTLTETNNHRLNTESYNESINLLNLILDKASKGHVFKTIYNQIEEIKDNSTGYFGTHLFGFISDRRGRLSAETIIKVKDTRSNKEHLLWVRLRPEFDDEYIAERQEGYPLTFDFIELEGNKVKKDGIFHSVQVFNQLQGEYLDNVSDIFIGDKWDWECTCDDSDCDMDCIEEERYANINRAENWMVTDFFNNVSKGIINPDFSKPNLPIVTPSIFEDLNIEVEDVMVNLPSLSCEVKTVESLEEEDRRIYLLEVFSTDGDVRKEAAPEYVRFVTSGSSLDYQIGVNNCALSKRVSKVSNLLVLNDKVSIIIDSRSLEKIGDGKALLLYGTLNSKFEKDLSNNNSVCFAVSGEKENTTNQLKLTHPSYNVIVSPKGYSNIFDFTLEVLSKKTDINFKVLLNGLDERKYFTYKLGMSNNVFDIDSKKQDIKSSSYSDDLFYYEICAQEGLNDPNTWLSGEDDVRNLVANIVKSYFDSQYGIGFIKRDPETSFLPNDARDIFDIEKILPYLEKSKINFISTPIKVEGGLGVSDENGEYDLLELIRTPTTNSDGTYNTAYYGRKNIYGNYSELYTLLLYRDHEHSLKLKINLEFRPYYTGNSKNKHAVNNELILEGKDGQVIAKHKYTVNILADMTNNGVGFNKFKDFNFFGLNEVKTNPYHVLQTAVICLDTFRQSLDL